MEQRQILPLEAVVSYITNKSKVFLTLKYTEIECKIVGVDEYMNLVIDVNEERMLVKGNNIVVISLAE
ncbi:hypothetical protein TUBRATIS_008980 [Tubulinosema ratisbonensis]|uniref:Uncharacterized protein n=1 Tax=Tubulinosema ratisbonensis TaxID=291195 RepID=A0A437ANL4_9MICR|nr:hypothetical protein TUBRATIS_008980 [Tubulinosema ratisbonensis]